MGGACGFVDRSIDEIVELVRLLSEIVELLDVGRVSLPMGGGMAVWLDDVEVLSFSRDLPWALACTGYLISLVFSPKEVEAVF